MEQWLARIKHIELERILPKQLAWVALTFVFSLLAIQLHRSQQLERIDRTILDVQFKKFPREDTLKKVVILSIDQGSLRQFSERLGIYWPWRRDIYGMVLNYLYEDGARVVGFDVLFDQPDFNRLDSDGPTNDIRFAEALANWPQTVLAMQLQIDEELPPAAGYIPQRFQVDLTPPRPMRNLSVSTMPIRQFMDQVNLLGDAFIPTYGDAVIRQVPLFRPIGEGKVVPGLALACYLSWLNTTPELEWTSRFLRINAQRIPLQKNQSYLINWYKKGGVREGTFVNYSFFAALQTAIAEAQGAEHLRVIPKGAFADKIVMVGASAAGLADIKSTPMSALEPFPGVEIHANVLNNLLQESYLRSLNDWVFKLVIVGVLAMVLGLVLYWPPLAGFASSTFVIASYWGVGIWLFRTERLWLPQADVMVVGLMAFVTAYAYKYATELRQKKSIKSAFGRYVQKELVQELIEKPELLQLGGQKKELTILFSDLAGFTTISESMEPEDLVALLNEYLTEMTDIVFKHGGTLDKYIGDAIMAFWGAPLPQEDHATRACACVLDMEEAVARMRERWKVKNLPEIIVRYGINSGNVVVGNMGSLERFNYTVMGDAVNLAARLEPANKPYNTNIIISEFTQSKLGDRFLVRELDRLVVKGKTQHVVIYELMADLSQNEVNQNLKKVVERFHSALNLYYQAQFDQALQAFREILNDHPHDGPSMMYMQRCASLYKNPPAQWNGVYVMTTK